MNGKLKTIPLASITPTPHNQRAIIPGDPKIKELSESISANGLLQPVICRPLGKHGYELLAGRRRFEAHKLLAGQEDILAIVADLDDNEALVVTITENLQREGLTPLEQARDVAALLATGRDTADVAAILGKSHAWVRRRSRLATLSPKWIAAIEGELPDGDKAKPVQVLRETISMAVLEIAAALPHDTQDAVLKKLLSDTWRTQPMSSAPAFKSLVADFCREIGSMPWAQTDCFEANGENLPECIACQSRSDFEPDLFAGLCHGDDGAQCLDETCYQRKYEAFVAEAAAKAERKAGQPVVKILTGHRMDAPDSDYKEWQVTEAKKTDKGAVPAIRVNGPDAGKLFYVKPNKQVRAQEQEKDQEPTREAKLLLHMCDAFDTWVINVEDCPEKLADPQGMIAALAMFDVYDTDDTYETTIEQFDLMASGKVNDTIYKSLWLSLRETLQMHCYIVGADQERLDKYINRLDLALHICGLDKQDFIDKAELEVTQDEPATTNKAKKTKKAKKGVQI